MTIGQKLALSIVAVEAAICAAFSVDFSCRKSHQMLQTAPNVNLAATAALRPKRRNTLLFMVDDSPAIDSVFSYEEQKLIEELYAKVADDGDIKKVLEETLPSLPPSLVIKLRQAGEDPHEMIRFVASQMNEMLDAQLEEAKMTLQELLDAGEIRKLDAVIGKSARTGKLNVPFFNVLNFNLKDASAEVASNIEKDLPTDGEGAASRLQILQHIYTRCQEEVEKSIPPGLALLNRLLRQPQQPIRLNLYDHYLTPQSNKISTPDGKEIELQGQAAPMVPLEEFVSAIANTVEQIRTVENAGATDRTSAANMVESCRQIAKEARVVIGESFGVESEELNIFQEGLQPVFRPTTAESPYIKGQ
eukprot:CAMPEP_0198141726 /NCGR_PEP_ID=MMETSP1443-20131203/4668_1 /TAXON_ID=186043 /ORGANISM="Entomoneis sp., Strain CCMP2396" /LENGTH=360 /DNA_ID=CAMNT_0043804549 /DNA_START=62 /DNA_END=1144 /DNA_ORIENTATION=-